MLAVQLVVVVAVVGAAAGLAYVDARSDAQDAAAAQATSIARTVADSPEVVAALTDPNPSTVLQPLAERVRLDTGVDFVVVMNPDRTRYSHPNPDLIGEPFIGTIAEAAAGGTVTEVYTGTLGPSIRAVVPVFASPRTAAETPIVGLVSVGITVEAIGAMVTRALPGLVLAGSILLLLAVLSTVALTRRLRRVTYGLGPEELARMYDYYDAVLRSVREGLLLIDHRGRVQLVNDEARRLLGLPDTVTGTAVSDLRLPPLLSGALKTGADLTDEIHLTADRVVVVSSRSAIRTDDGATGPSSTDGRIVTIRDHTEVQELAGELDTTRRLSEALRSQAHEAANRLHTVVSLIELGRTEDAVQLATNDLALAQRLTDRIVDTVEEPVVAALLLGKSAVAAEVGIELRISAHTAFDSESLVATGMSGSDMVTILGNLLDNAIDACRLGEPPRFVEVSVRSLGGELVVEVSDSGPGLEPDDTESAFRRGWSSKSSGPERLHGRGLGLALVGQTVARLGGTVSVGRRVGAVFTIRIPQDSVART